MLKQEQLRDVLHRLGLARRDQLLICLAVETKKAKSVARLRALAVDAGLPEASRWNISDILSGARGLAILTGEGWLLTSEGRRHVGEVAKIRTLGGSAAKVAADLRGHLQQIADDQTREFVTEAIACFEAGFDRAAVVLSWVGAISLLQNEVVAKHLSPFNAEATRRNNRWRAARTADELGKMGEHDFLDVLEAISVIGNNVKQELQNLCLKLRNACGHPNTLRLAESRVAAHIDQLILNVFSRFGDAHP